MAKILEYHRSEKYCAISQSTTGMGATDDTQSVAMFEFYLWGGFPSTRNPFWNSPEVILQILTKLCGAPATVRLCTSTFPDQRVFFQLKKSELKGNKPVEDRKSVV